MFANFDQARNSSFPELRMSRYLGIFLCTAVSALIALGLVMLASTSVWVRGVEDPYHFVSRQSMMLVVGLVGAVIVSRLAPDFIRRGIWPGLIFTTVLLALCFIPPFAAPELGANRWIRVPFINRFQPSEMARILIVLFLGHWYARWQTENGTFFRGFFVPGFVVAIPLGLIAIETDVGSALSISVCIAAVMYCVGTRLIYLLPTAVTGMTGAWFYIRSNENRWSRIEAWLNLDDPVHQLGFGMQQWRALLALGNGGPTGVGLGNGSEKFGTLVYSHIDFIFPNIGEELGLAGTLSVVICYVVIALCGMGIAMQARDLFQRAVALGLTCSIVVPAIVNIAVTTALVPNDGLPLPFVSYGGTSLVFNLVGVGLLVGIHRRSRRLLPNALPVGREVRYAIRL